MPFMSQTLQHTISDSSSLHPSNAFSAITAPLRKARHAEDFCQIGDPPASCGLQPSAASSAALCRSTRSKNVMTRGSLPDHPTIAKQVDSEAGRSEELNCTSCCSEWYTRRSSPIKHQALTRTRRVGPGYPQYQTMQQAMDCTVVVSISILSKR